MLRPGHTIVLCVLALLAIGVIMVNSADMAVRSVSSDTPVIEPLSVFAILTSRSAVYMTLAVGAMVAAAFFPVRKLAGWAERPAQGADAEPSKAAWRTWSGLAVGALALVLVCALVYMPGIERARNGSHRWISIPGTGDALSLQPSEVAKWTMVVLISWYCVRSARASLAPAPDRAFAPSTDLSRFFTGLCPALAAVGMVSGFIVLEDLGTGALIALVAGLLLLAGGARLRHFIALSPFPLAAVVAAIMTSDYRMARIMAFRNPYSDPEGIGYHTIQSLVAVAGGEGWGRGLGFGIQKLGYLPEDRTDFLFAVICEELGIAGAAVVIALFIALVWAGYAVMRREHSAFLRLVTLGIISTVSVQAIINLAVVTAVAPTKGIALPLLSYGGTGWVMTGFSLGLIVAIDRTQRAARKAESLMLRPVMA
ncbi:MAG: FtsW/RodA/SpoVE family cell cycle protein [Phycisphaerales bacterium]